MSDRAPYSRVYWSIVDDPKFATIFDNDRHLATWLRLLLIADQAHPASASIPSGVSRASLTALSEAGLLSLGTGSRFRIAGLDKERAKRSETARTAAALRWDSDRIFTPMPRRDETSKDETRRVTREDLDADGREDIEAFVLVTRRAPTPRQRQLLDGLLDRHDLTGPKWAADIILRNPDNPIGAVIEADKAWREEQIAKAQASERPQPTPRRPRGLPTSAKALLEEWASARTDPDAA